MRKAGADAVVSPGYIGGLRMASEMIRPTVVSFLDIMLRDRDSNLRVEEVAVPDSLAGKTISELNLESTRYLPFPERHRQCNPRPPATRFSFKMSTYIT